jgi:hypothetical protein
MSSAHRSTELHERLTPEQLQRDLPQHEKSNEHPIATLRLVQMQKATRPQLLDLFDACGIDTAALMLLRADSAAFQRFERPGTQAPGVHASFV